MTFKIILTVLFALSALMAVENIGKPRPTITGIGALLGIVTSGVFIYGLWNWI